MYGLLVFSVVAALRNPFAGFLAVLLLFLVQVATDNLFAGNLAKRPPRAFRAKNAAAYGNPVLDHLQNKMSGKFRYGASCCGTEYFGPSSAWFVLGCFSTRSSNWNERLFVCSQTGRPNENSSRAFPMRLPQGYHRPVARVDFSVRRQIQAMLQLSIVDFKYIIRSWLFHVMLLFGILALVFALSRVTNRGDLTFLPLTRIMLSIPMFFFSTVIMLLTFLYSGMLVHRAQMAKANQLIDATGTSNWVLLGSKILALLGGSVVLLCVLMMCGIGLQLYHGYYHLEIGHITYIICSSSPFPR
ncbi:MAG: hypothetical protein IPK21_09995 [Haliscomenobacter sp.]|nr:hypothetical protein [Haliscomenobacter sp.]